MVQLRSDISIVKNVGLQGNVSGCNVFYTEVYGYDSLDEYAVHRKELQSSGFNEASLSPESPIEWYISYLVIGKYIKCDSFDNNIDITYKLVLHDVER